MFRSLTVDSAAHCHVMCKDDCLCASIYYFPLSKKNNCELNDVKKDMEPLALKWNQGANYYDLATRYTVRLLIHSFAWIFPVYLQGFFISSYFAIG